MVRKHFSRPVYCGVWPESRNIWIGATVHCYATSIIRTHTSVVTELELVSVSAETNMLTTAAYIIGRYHGNGSLNSGIPW
jgi:hypothetical protein